MRARLPPSPPIACRAIPHASTKNKKEALLLHKDKSARQIFGDIDGLKLRSSMTLFALQSPPNSVFHQVLDAFFDGEKDAVTLSMLQL
ncbi:MAG: DUF1810 domain-containing protein [Ruminococcaceae bacterium]|nr:DUF1810 domain-containing protein [Oscillospiraceae bacterium]